MPHHSEQLAGGTILLSQTGRVSTATLNRPEKRNALDKAMIEALHECLTRAEANGSSVLELRGAPGAFSAGADIAGYQDAPENRAELAEFTATARDLCTRLSTSEVVVVAVVDGIAMGGGFEIVLAADLVVCSETSILGLPEISLGLIPGWGGTQRLTQLIGIQRAKAAIFTAKRFTAAEAISLGLATTMVPQTELVSAATELISTLAAQAPLALRAAQSAITAAHDPAHGRTRGAAEETARLLELFCTADGVEGVAAFLAKRRPQFTGN